MSRAPLLYHSVYNPNKIITLRQRSTPRRFTLAQRFLLNLDQSERDQIAAVIPERQFMCAKGALGLLNRRDLPLPMHEDRTLNLRLKLEEFLIQWRGLT